MTAYLYLLVQKKWRFFCFFTVIILISAFAVQYFSQQKQQLFQLPIAIQNLDDSAQTKKIVHALQEQPYLKVTELPQEEQFLAEQVEKGRYVVLIIFPERLAEKLKKNDMKDAISLYMGEQIGASIATEMISRVIYEFQIPHIILKELQKNDEGITLADVVSAYNSEQIEDELQVTYLHEQTETSISSRIVLISVLFLSLVQLLFHRHLSQEAVLQRLTVYQRSFIRFYVAFALVYSLFLTFLILICNVILNIQISFIGIFQIWLYSFWFEWGVSILYVKMPTWSHQLVIATLWWCLIMVSILYV